MRTVRKFEFEIWFLFIIVWEFRFFFKLFGEKIIGVFLLDYFWADFHLFIYLFLGNFCY